VVSVLNQIWCLRTYLSKCIGKITFKTKFDRFNSGVNPDFDVNFSYNPEITLKYGLKTKLCTTFIHGLASVSTLNFVLNFGINKRYSDPVCWVFTVMLALGLGSGPWLWLMTHEATEYLCSWWSYSTCNINCCDTLSFIQETEVIISRHTVQFVTLVDSNRNITAYDCVYCDRSNMADTE